jgi:beta-lactam-binding protein with PASTA domain
MTSKELRALFFSFLWLMPFLSFIAGYQFVRFFTHIETVKVPSVMGLHMNDAIKILSTDLLNVRILAEKEDPDLHEGTILSQMPEPGQLVKTHQSIFLVITRKPPELRAPQLRGLTYEQAQTKAAQAGITLASASFESTFPRDKVIAQSVLPDKEVPHKSLMIYYSEGTTPLRIFPNLKGLTVDEVVAFFDLYSGIVQVEGDRTKFIKEQRPGAGTLIDIRKPLTIQVVCASH